MAAAEWGGAAMSQTAAIFVDAYRELNARKLFWISLGLSGLVVLVFLAVGIDERGVSFLWFRLMQRPNTSMVDAATFYKGMFIGLGVSFWLAFIATILALVSTAGIFPDLVAGGSIELYLSKPISRLRLFFTRYAAALTFVFLQVAIFCFASFLVLGVRGGTWIPDVFLAIPIVLIFYSYLYCVCVFLGLLTRSTIAALLLTILFWLAIFAMHAVESGSLLNRMQAEVAIERLNKTVEERQARLQSFDVAGGEATQLNRRAPMVETLEKARQNLAAAHANRAANWHSGLFAVKTALPKTTETIALLERWMKTATDLERHSSNDKVNKEEEDAPPGSIFNPMGPDQFKAQVRLQKEIRDRSIGWVIGTSLGFEAVILALAAWVFCRRDY
jgi:ABC-type transport system involved in multi-copper enzyme maturation permease subunit